MEFVNEFDAIRCIKMNKLCMELEKMFLHTFYKIFENKLLKHFLHDFIKKKKYVYTFYSSIVFKKNLTKSWICPWTLQ